MLTVVVVVMVMVLVLVLLLIGLYIALNFHSISLREYITFNIIYLLPYSSGTT